MYYTTDWTPKFPYNSQKNEIICVNNINKLFFVMEACYIFSDVG
jgi:hypothetical protein